MRLDHEAVLRKRLSCAVKSGEGDHRIGVAVDQEHRWFAEGLIVQTGGASASIPE